MLVLNDSYSGECVTMVGREMSAENLENLEIESSKGGEKRKVVEVIDIEDDDDKDSYQEEEEDINEDVNGITEVGDITAAVKERLEERVDAAMVNILKPLYDIIEEDVTPTARRRINVDKSPVDEDELMKELENLSKIFENIRAPESVLIDLLGDSTPSLAAKTARPSKGGAGSGVRKSSCVSPTKERERESLPPPSSPSRSVSSTGSSRTTLFFCPLTKTGCHFYTTKAGMEEGAAAKHLQNEHKVTGAEMRTAPSGTYKFRRVKQENKIL